MSESNISTEFSAMQFGTNLRICREARGRTLQDVSRMLGIPTSRLKNHESGQFTPSLPEAEALSFIYHVPIFALLDASHLPEFIHDPNGTQLGQLLDIRRRIIATQLQIAREKKGISTSELGKKTGIPASRIKRYESGLAPIPMDELNRIILALDVLLEDLADSDSPVGTWQQNQALMNRFKGIPQEIQRFASDPQNRPWVEFIDRLKQAGESSLLALAESIRALFNHSRD